MLFNIFLILALSIFFIKPKITAYISQYSSRPVGQILEPLIEMFRLDEKVLAYAEKFIKYCRENFIFGVTIS